MQSGFTAILPSPLRLRPDEPHACTVGVVVNLPRRCEERVYIAFGKEIRSAMRSVQNADLPLVGIRRRRLKRTHLACYGRAQVQHITGPQHASCMPAELTK